MCVDMMQELFETPYFPQKMEYEHYKLARPFEDNPVLARYSPTHYILNIHSCTWNFNCCWFLDLLFFDFLSLKALERPFWPLRDHREVTGGIMRD